MAITSLELITCGAGMWSCWIKDLSHCKRSGHIVGILEHAAFYLEGCPCGSFGVLVLKSLLPCPPVWSFVESPFVESPSHRKWKSPGSLILSVGTQVIILYTWYFMSPLQLLFGISFCHHPCLHCSDVFACQLITHDNLIKAM